MTELENEHELSEEEYEELLAVDADESHEGEDFEADLPDYDPAQFEDGGLDE